jgi:hypothetical protein
MQHYIPQKHGFLKVYKSGLGGGCGGGGSLGGGGGGDGDGGGGDDDDGDDSMSQFFIINLLSQQPKGQLITKSALEHKENTLVTDRV